jgi:hypothetical protein
VGAIRPLKTHIVSIDEQDTRIAGGACFRALRPGATEAADACNENLLGIHIGSLGRCQMNFGEARNASIDVAQVPTSSISSPSVVGFKGQNTIVVFDSSFKFRQVTAVQMSEVRKNWDALFIAFEHGQQEPFCGSQIVSQHHLFSIVEKLKLFSAQIINVVKVCRHGLTGPKTPAHPKEPFYKLRLNRVRDFTGVLTHERATLLNCRISRKKRCTARQRTMRSAGNV